MMEYLNRLLVKMHSKPKFKFHAKCKNVGLTNLILVDDILLFSRGDVNSVQMLMNIVQIFSKTIGLVINPRKFKVFCGGMDRDTQNLLCRITDFEEGKLPMKYLGVPITSKRLSLHHYLPLIDKITHRMKHWTTKLLSYAGRISLVKSIVLAITQYWMQCLPLPQFVIHKIDQLCRTFVWTGDTTESRKSPVAWSTVCSPKSQGGKCIINLAMWNKITLLNCLWNLCKKSDNMWVKWVHMVYLKGEDVMVAQVVKDSSWIVKRILELRDQVLHIQSLWDSMLTHEKFRMNAVYDLLTNRDQNVDWRGLCCRNAARPRAVFTTWLICHGRLATKHRLKKFTVIRDSNCSLCHDEEETIAHLVFACRYTYDVWQRILAWINVNHLPLPWNEELRWVMEHTAKKGWKACLLKMAFIETLYGIWHRRNIVIFGPTSHTDIVYSIIDCIIYRGWQHHKIKKHIAHMLS
ncbi:uncharacterized protein LOC131607445 [Vicia villosa]|uniref:uncharacterized protein LOC131607445 n=1 Tax=Vicia villosa TaxID=3911 RepID=UPI00273BE36F|nr:uncharacterized protein LOC131607445 [Vicia villosa]